VLAGMFGDERGRKSLEEEERERKKLGRERRIYTPSRPVSAFMSRIHEDVFEDCLGGGRRQDF
jgi:hypothetical protein